MALKTFKPYTKSTRGTILVDRTGLWKGKPFKKLVEPKNTMKGRNNNGHITSRNRAGGHKQMYRVVDFYRKKFDMPGKVERIEYDPNRSCYIMLIKFDDGQHFYYLAPQKIKVGDIVENGTEKEIRANGLLSTCIQHEVDHLNGILFIDYLSKLKKDMIVKKLVKHKKELNKIIL